MIRLTPLPQLVAELQRAEDYGQSVNRHMHETQSEPRWDLVLHCLTSRRMSQRYECWPHELDRLIQEVNDCFVRDDLVPSLLRVFVVSDRDTLDRLRDQVSPSLLIELIGHLRAWAGRLESRHPIDRAAASMVIEHVCLRLAPPSSVPVQFDQLTAWLSAATDFCQSMVRTKWDGLAVNTDGAVFPSTSAHWRHGFQHDVFAFTSAALDSLQGVLAHFFDADLEFGTSRKNLSTWVHEARRIQWQCWRTARQLKLRHGYLQVDLTRGCDFGRLEVHALAQLAQFDRLSRAHVSALRFAVGAFKKASQYKVQQDAWPFRSLSRFLADHLGAIKPPYSPWRGPAVDEPRLALRLARQEDPVLDSAVALLLKEGLEVKGWGALNFHDLGSRLFDSGTRAATFQLALRTGSLVQARRHFHLSSKEENRIYPTRIAEQKDAIRLQTAELVGKFGLTRWAEAVAEIGQGGIPWLDKQEQNRIKSSVRKLVKFGGSAMVDQLEPREVLFVNHAQIGFSYHATRVHRAKFAAAGAADLTNGTDIDRFLEASERQELRPIELRDFREGGLTAKAGSVFISLLTDDGKSLRMTVVSQQDCRSERPTSCSIQDDWANILKNFAKDSESQIVRMDVWGEDVSLKIPEPLQAACRAMLTLALAADPNVRRILLHADPMWNVVPWQYIAAQQLGTELGHQIEELIQRKRRQSQYRDLGALIFWRVPGFQFATTAPRAVPEAIAASDVLIDKSEPQFGELKSTLTEGRDAVRKGGTPSRGLLSLLAHGTVGGERVEFNIGSSTMDAMQLAAYGSYPVVFLHICHAADRGNLTLGDDVMGAPGEIILGGARVVIAPGLPVPVADFNRLEQWFYDLDGALPSDQLLSQVEDRYRRACSESSRCALYTLYSGDIAPCLERPANQEGAVRGYSYR